MNTHIAALWHSKKQGAFIVPAIANRKFALAALMVLLCTWAVNAAAAVVGFNDLSVPIFGVQLTVLGMSAAGSLVGFAYGKPVTSRRTLYTSVVANALVGAWAVILLPEWRGWVVSPVAQPPLAGALAMAARFVIPAAIDALPALFARLVSIIGIPQPPKGDKP